MNAVLLKTGSEASLAVEVGDRVDAPDLNTTLRPLTETDSTALEPPQARRRNARLDLADNDLNQSLRPVPTSGGSNISTPAIEQDPRVIQINRALRNFEGTTLHTAQQLLDQANADLTTTREHLTTAGVLSWLTGRTAQLAQAEQVDRRAADHYTDHMGTLLEARQETIQALRAGMRLLGRGHGLQAQGDTHASGEAFREAQNQLVRASQIIHHATALSPYPTAELLSKPGPPPLPLKQVPPLPPAYTPITVVTPAGRDATLLEQSPIVLTLHSTLQKLYADPAIQKIKSVRFEEDLGSFRSSRNVDGQPVRALPLDENGEIKISLKAITSPNDMEKLILDYLRREHNPSAYYQSIQTRRYTRLAGNLAAGVAAATPEAPNGSFEGHPILGRDHPITGSVSIEPIRPPIVIAPERDPVLRQAYATLLKSVQRTPPLETSEVLEKVFLFVSERMPYWRPHEHGGQTVDEAVAQRIGLSPGGSLPLGEFLVQPTGVRNRILVEKVGGGVCAHQALLAGHLLERLQQDGYLDPALRISYDRNRVEGMGAHAWIRITGAAGEPIRVLDVAQHVLGEINGKNRWLYARDSDAKALLERPL